MQNMEADAMQKIRVQISEESMKDLVPPLCKCKCCAQLSSLALSRPTRSASALDQLLILILGPSCLVMSVSVCTCIRRPLLDKQTGKVNLILMLSYQYLQLI
jgi:hypothetical protein